MSIAPRPASDHPAPQAAGQLVKPPGARVRNLERSQTGWYRRSHMTRPLRRVTTWPVLSAIDEIRSPNLALRGRVSSGIRGRADRPVM
jgi:hypothetical protein